MDVGKKIKTTREDKQLTQTQLAQMAGISLRMLQSYEKGERIPPEKKLIRIAEALDVNVLYLKGLDVTSDPESIRQLLIFLEESNIFSIDDVNVMLSYDEDENDCYRMSIPISKATARMLAEWKAYSKTTPTFPEVPLSYPNELEEWKRRKPYTFNTNAYSFPDSFSTYELLALDFMDYKLMISRLENKQYTKNNFINILIELNRDSGFRDDTEYHTKLLHIFMDPSQPQELLNEIFENANDIPKYQRLNDGIVKTIFEESRNQTKSAP